MVQPGDTIAVDVWAHTERQRAEVERRDLERRGDVSRAGGDEVDDGPHDAGELADNRTVLITGHQEDLRARDLSPANVTDEQIVASMKRAIDYRSVLGEIIRDHLGATQEQDEAFPKNWEDRTPSGNHGRWS